MDNDDAIVGRIYSRREALATAAKAGLGLAFGGLAGVGRAQQVTATSVHLVASPVVTEGPFFVDEHLLRSNLLEGATRVSVVNGLPLRLKFRVFRLNGDKYVPLKGAHVDVWHADAVGVYSDESNPMNHENTAGQKWLRGYQVSDAMGLVTFETIFPGWYESRATHIHFKIRNVSETNKTAEFTSQLFFDDKVADKVFSSAPYKTRSQWSTYNRSDNIFMERQVDGSTAGSHLLLSLSGHPSGRGYAAEFNVALTDDNTKPRRGGFPGGPGGPPPGWG